MATAAAIARVTSRFEGAVGQAMTALPPKVKKFLTNIRKGENMELKTELNSEYRDRRKEAVKRVIANMTVGKDVSGLFADVLKCMQTDDLELKKLVYLYLMNYARTQPELVILAVNSFVKDADDPNPLIRALAVRTMGCLRAEKIVDYLMEPLRKTLKDSDPYVRKTAAICVAKMFDLKPQLTVDNGFVTMLQDLLSDANPMVVANAVAALREIQENPRNKDAVFVINGMILHKLLAALNECTEWGQIFILESLAEYVPRDITEIKTIMERVLPRLSHANASVVLGAVRVLLLSMDRLNGAEPDLVTTVVRKLSPPLVSLLAATPEMTYVALRNIELVLQKRPDVLANEIKVFFCKYNDPQYVKMEKLDIMMRLTSDRNVDVILLELKEYANEVDVEFVRKAIRAIGTCAIKIEAAAEPCVGTLLDLIRTRVSHVVQEAMVVVKDIFRKYPGRYEGIIPVLCEHLDVLDEEEARAALLWMVGEYADRIANASDLLQVFVDGFKDEHVTVQLQLLTATIKCFLRRPEAQPLVQQVLQLATASDLPDLRDRAFVYWRLLSSGASVASVMGPCPPIEYEAAEQLSPALLAELTQNLGSLAAVWQKPVNTVSPAKALAGVRGAGGDDEDEDEDPVSAMGGGGSVSSPAAGTSTVGTAAVALQEPVPNLLDLDFDLPAPLPPPSNSTFVGGSTAASPMPAAIPPPASLLDLLGSSPPMAVVAPNAGAGMSLAGLSTSPILGASASLDLSPASPTAAQRTKSVLLSKEQGNGLEILGVFTGGPPTNSAPPSWTLELVNHTPAPLADFAIQLNTNALGIAPAQPLASVMAAPVVPANGGRVAAVLPLTVGNAAMRSASGAVTDQVQAAVKSSAGIVYFAGAVPGAWMAAAGVGGV
ncbi:hypothetical protein GGF32_009621 [Allomyces javanicus]|nr:hypothetical protein GGF32_009621 [Allomyces javanicus]